MGQPDRIHFTWSPLAGYDFDPDRRLSRVALSMTGEARVPQLGLLAMSFEGYGGEFGGTFDYGLGTYLKIPWIRAGFEYSFVEHEFVPGFSTDIALRRGGLFRVGDEFHLDYRPWDKQVLLGLTFRQPLHQYRRARPLKTHVSLPKGSIPEPEPPIRAATPLPGFEEALEGVEHAVAWIDQLLTPQFGTGREFAASAKVYAEHIRTPGHTFAEEDERYHRELERAFTHAAGGDTELGRDLALRAEAIVLEQVLIPFNRQFAVIKKPARLGGFVEPALAEFADYLSTVVPETPSGTAAGPRELCREVFRRTLAAVDGVSREARKRWDQKFIFLFPEFRLVWLPLNYGLRSEQFDTREEWDRLTEVLTEVQFSDCNRVEYLINEQFHLRLKAMVRETEVYQVIHIHDIRGRYGSGTTDRIGWDLVIDGYLRSFTEAVQAMDRGERKRLPQYLIFLDENFYQENRAREMISFLEQLYDPEPLKLSDEAVQREVLAAHQEMRNAIADSPHFSPLSEDELKDLFRIHVSITHQYDPVFGADVSMRDHRKVAFRDVFEDDPDSGEGLATGLGVGEHYNGTGWDDRSIWIRGPALGELKTGARELFLSQGYEAKDVPECLRAIPLPADYAERCRLLRDRGWSSRVTAVMNDVGYGDKRATVLKVMQYNLAPPASTILSFDSLWISDYWAGMLTAAALRGVSVYIVAPTQTNAPSSAVPTMVLLRENLVRMFQASESFRAEIEAAGGRLSVGLYNSDLSVRNPRGWFAGIADHWERDPGFWKELGLHPDLGNVFTEIAASASTAPEMNNPDNEPVIPIDSGHKPFIHMKVQFFTNGTAGEVFGDPGWGEVFRKYAITRAKQLSGAPTNGITPDLLKPLGPTVLRSGDSDAPGGELTHLFVGSQNQDRRGMMLDGEITIVVSGPEARMALPDLFLILGNATWPRDQREFTETFPEVKAPRFLKRVFRYIKDQI